MQYTPPARPEEWLRKAGYIISLSGNAMLLFWIGITKFTPTEAKAIEPLISNSFLMSWMYDMFSLFTTSKIIGSIELLIAIGLVASLRNPRVGMVAAAMGVVTFAITLSFLFTTPGLWRLMDGVPVTNFFILKDVTVIGVCLTILAKCITKERLLRKQRTTSD